MLWFAVIICYLSAAYHIYINRGRLITVGGVISIIWGTINMINAISPYDWYPLSDRCKMILLIGSLAMAIGLFSNRGVPYSIVSRDEQSLDLDAKYKEFFILQIILALIMVPMVIKAVSIIMSSNLNLAALRTIYATGGEDGSYMSTFQRLFYIHYVVGPSAFACILIDSMLFFRHGLWKKPLVYIVLLAVLEAVYSAARTIIFFSAIAILVSFFIYKGHANSQYDVRRVRRRIRRIFIVLAGFMIVITLLRGNTNNSAVGYVFKTLITYFCGGTRLLNQTIENPLSFGLDSYQYGYCTFAGLFSIINLINMYFLGRVGLNIFPINFAADMHVQDYIARNVRIGSVSSINAFPTMYYFFLRDGGIIFLIIIVVILGRMITAYERKSVRQNSLNRTFTYSLFFYVAIMTVCWWEPIRTEFWMILFWGKLFCRMLEKRQLYE